VCRINRLKHINGHINNKCNKGMQSLYYDISVDYKIVECGWITVFFCDILIMGSALGAGSNFLEVELDASSTFSILPFGFFVDWQVIGRQGDIFPAMQQLNLYSLISNNFKDNHYKYLCVNIFLGQILTSPELCNKYNIVQFLRETWLIMTYHEKI